MGNVSAAGKQAGRDFVGRATELARLLAGLDDARDGHGRLVLVSGPPGIGKSRLVAEFARAVSDVGIRVLMGRSWEAGGAPPFWPWLQALRGYLRAAGSDAVLRQAGAGLSDIATLLPELADLTGGPSPTRAVDISTDRFRLFDATVAFLRNVAAEDPLVIVLEDLQAADVPSLLLLRFLAGEVADSRILVVATYRDVELGPDHPLSSAVVELRRAPATAALALAGLDVEEAARLLEVETGRPARDSVVHALHRQTGGNPLFLHEALRLLTDPAGALVGAPGTQVVIPAEILAVIERRLDGLSAVLRALLETASVYGNEFQLEWLHRHDNRAREETLELLGEAVVAGLVVETTGRGHFRFSHDLIRHTLYAGLPAARRISLHRRAADILESAYAVDLEDHLATLAYHHFEAAAGGDREAAIDYGRRAGDQALHSYAYEEAERMYEMAIQVLEEADSFDPTMLTDLLLSLGDARVKAGDLPEAEDAFLRAAEVAQRQGDARRLAQAAGGYGGRFVWARAGADTRMVPLLQDALVLLGGEDDALRVHLLSRLSCALRSSADRDHLDALSRQALELARSLDDGPALIYALTGRAGAIWWPENPEERVKIGEELVAISEECGAVEGAVDGHVTRFVALAEMGDFNGARSELDAISRLGGPLRSPTHRWLEGTTRALVALLEGNLGEVEPWIEELQAQAPPTPARDNLAVARFQLFLLRREQGRLEEAVDLIRGAAADFPWYPIHQLALIYTLVDVGRDAEAGLMLADLAADRFSRLHRDNYWIPSLCLAVEVAVRLSEREAAATLYELLSPYSHRVAIGFPEGSLGSVARYVGLAAGEAGDMEAAEGYLREAEATHRRIGAGTWLAHTLYDLAALMSRRAAPGDLIRATSSLEECRRLSSQLGLISLEKAANSSLERLGAPAGEAAAAQGAAMLREGDYFSVEFAGDAFRVKDSKGVRYLAALLSSPGREVHVLDLVTAIEGVDPAVRGRPDVGEVQAGAEEAGPVLDAAAREAYKRRLAELEEDIVEAEAFGDDERAYRAREERDFLAAELTGALGLGGRDRPVASAAERARVNVTRALRAAMERMRGHSSALGEHLDATIRTGVFCSYSPDPRVPISWRV